MFCFVAHILYHTLNTQCLFVSDNAQMNAVNSICLLTSAQSVRPSLSSPTILAPHTHTSHAASTLVVNTLIFKTKNEDN